MGKNKPLAGGLGVILRPRQTALRRVREMGNGRQPSESGKVSAIGSWGLFFLFFSDFFGETLAYAGTLAHSPLSISLLRGKFKTF